MQNCPRCQNSEINASDNYCKICGLDLKEATAATAADKLNAFGVLVNSVSTEYTTITDEKPNLLKSATSTGREENLVRRKAIESTTNDKSPMSVTVSREYLKDVHNSIVNSNKIIERFFLDEEVGVFEYFKFGLLYSSSLANEYKYEDYRKFIHQYNQVLTEKFEYPMRFIDEVYKYLSIKTHPLIVLSRSKLFLTDKTDIFRGNKFKQERDLERLLVNSLKDWSHEWTVKRQQSIGYGIVDISVSTSKEKLAIELKKDKAKREDVFQAYDYTKNNSGYDSILIAFEFDQDVLELANQLKVNCYEYQLGRLNGEEIPSAIFLNSVNDAKEKTSIELQLEEINYCDGHLIKFTDIPTTEEAFDFFVKTYSGFENALMELIKISDKNSKGRSHCPYCSNQIT